MEVDCLATLEHCKKNMNGFRNDLTLHEDKCTIATVSNWKLNSSVFMIPHPSKVAKGGEDANFISDDAKSIGVADGVGGWASHGVDPAIYANSIMDNSKFAYDELGLKEPLDILNYAYENASAIQGSSTACIIVLKDLQLQSVNIGDSGFMVIRSGKTIFRSKEQLHSFNFPYQLGTASINVPSDANKITLDVQQDDLVIMGSDGLFDNLWTNEILDIVNNNCSCTKDNEMKRGETLAEIIAKATYTKSQSTFETPFRKSACELGLVDSPNGGKLDDITVIVSRIVSTSSSNRSVIDPDQSSCGSG